MTRIPAALFRAKKNFRALQRLHEDLEKFQGIAVHERHVIVEAALAELAAELTAQVGRADIARDMTKRQVALIETAERYVQPKGARKPRVKKEPAVA